MQDLMASRLVFLPKESAPSRCLHCLLVHGRPDECQLDRLIVAREIADTVVALELSASREVASQANATTCQ